MLAHSGTFRSMAGQIKSLARELCQGRLLCVHEGGYSEVLVPFCGLAIVEELSGLKTDVIDPMFDIIHAQQPPADMVTLQRARLKAQAQSVSG
jgi:acetoin utilization deacetylase AcuC-like enzyme